eukprot:TRINITY_DN4144_c0_g1_i1.p3 TRINITY_DN4144_c0_g1~~TRINITY_DN4144_c0_g1_i1.p3  ORF type:complete len:55 (-),score=1.10 TRINITY_DN4144_c0_g1_i1:147-311(-)
MFAAIVEKWGPRMALGLCLFFPMVLSTVIWSGASKLVKSRVIDPSLSPKTTLLP